MSGESTVLLQRHLKQLKLPTIGREYEAVGQACAKEKASYPTYLLRLCERELLDRERRAAERRLRAAKFPVIKTLDTFDFRSQGSLNEPLVRELLRGEYIDQRENVLLMGNSGTGKTHLASALGFAACALGKKVRFFTVTQLVTELLEKREDRQLKRFLAFAGIGAVNKKPRFLSDNGSGYVGAALNDYLDFRGIRHIYAAPYHPQTNGKIERYHLTLKIDGSLLVLTTPDEFVRFMEVFVDYYNHERVHEALGNVTPSDAYYERRETILKARAELKKRSMTRREAKNQAGIELDLSVEPIRKMADDHPYWKYFGVLSETEKADLLVDEGETTYAD